MDNATKVLEEVRDLLRRLVESAAADRADTKAYREQIDQRTLLSLERQLAHQRFYKGVVLVGGLLRHVG